MWLGIESSKLIFLRPPFMILSLIFILLCVMKNLLFLLLIFLMAPPCLSQEKTIVIAESNLPYDQQEWFYAGAGNALQGTKIKACWDKGKRITSVAYTDHGWFVTMATGTGIGQQTYNVSEAWPSSWIKNNWEEDYYLTSIAYGNKQWVVVMSKHADYSEQSWNRDTIDKLATWIKQKWDENFYITGTAYNGTNWTIVMSKYAPYIAQGYLWASDTDILQSKIKSKVWDQGYNIQSIEYAAGKYFVVYCKYRANNGRTQTYQVNPQDVGNFIQQRWDKSQNIAYLGGGYPAMASYTTTNAVAARPQPQSPQNEQEGDKYYYFDLGYAGNMHMWQHPDGSCTITQNMRCYSCQGSLKCNICMGTGNGYYAINRYMPCPACGATGCCGTCKGTGFTSFTKTWLPGEAEAYMQAHREVESQYRSQSSQQNVRHNDYIETIYYRPNYTGTPYPDEYCEKCGQWMQPHSHIRKRY